MRREALRSGSSYDDWAKDCIGTPLDDDPESLILRREEIATLQFIWDDLDERSRLLLSGRYILDQSFEVLAQELNVSPGSARMMLTRAKRNALELMKHRNEALHND